MTEQYISEQLDIMIQENREYKHDAEVLTIAKRSVNALSLLESAIKTNIMNLKQSESKTDNSSAIMQNLAFLKTIANVKKKIGFETNLDSTK